MIMPEHIQTFSEMLKEYEQSKSGPTTYQPKFKLTEKRGDIGVMTIREPYYEKSAEDEEDTRPAIDPEPIKSNKLVFKYHEPTDHKPQHAPESVLKPGKWVFYDVDLDAVKEQLAKNVFFAGPGENQDEFKDRERFQYLLEEHLKRKNRKVPEHGSYEHPYAKDEP